MNTPLVMSTKVYLWVHELVHGWIALKIGCPKISIKIDDNKGSCTYWKHDEFNLLHQSQIEAAPFVFFIDRNYFDEYEYLRNEDQKARKTYDEFLKHRSRIGEYVTDVRRPIRRLLPQTDTLFRLARKLEYESEFETSILLDIPLNDLDNPHTKWWREKMNEHSTFIQNRD